jgi:hypothetical protein
VKAEEAAPNADIPEIKVRAFTESLSEYHHSSVVLLSSIAVCAAEVI